MQTAPCFSPNRVVLMDDPYNDPDKGALLEFRLTYEGLLLGASRVDTRSEHKHAIRKTFHPQLKRLWEIVPHLNSPQKSIAQFRVIVGDELPPPPPPRSEELANKYAYKGFRFVPLVTQELSLVCGIEILFLRPDHPGSVLQSGDIDNRLKTLFDALRMPSVGETTEKMVPDEGENPFYCLLEDDRLITKVSVDTDTLLQPTGDQPNANDARLVITVKIRPAELSWDNVAFG
jgi:hypothetical protein